MFFKFRKLLSVRKFLNKFIIFLLRFIDYLKNSFCDSYKEIWGGEMDFFGKIYSLI